MKIRDKKLIIYLLLLTAVTAAAATLRTLACFKDLDLASRHFNDGTLFTVSLALVAFGVIGSIASVIFTAQKTRPTADCHDAGTYITSGILGGAFVFFAFEAGREMLAATSITAKFLLILTALLAIVSVGYMFLHSFLGRRYSQIRGLAGIGTVACLAFYSLYLLADTTLPLNAPCRIVDQMAFVFASLFFLGEVRLSIGRELWKFYTATGMIAMLLTAYSAIPAIIYYFANATESGALLSKSVAETALSLSIFAFISVRTFKIAFLKADEPGAVAKAVSDKANAAVSDDEQEVTDNDSQISIDDIIEKKEPKEGYEGKE